LDKHVMRDPSASLETRLLENYVFTSSNVGLYVDPETNYEINY